jgi:hypothetical protein
MKRAFLTAILAFAFLPATAMAEYVCRANYFPGNTSVPGRIRVNFTSLADCAGTTRQLWFCDNRYVGPSSSCAVSGLRYDKDEILALFQQLVRAADSQQSVSASTTGCSDGVTSGCGYAVDFGR